MFFLGGPMTMTIVFVLIVCLVVGVCMIRRGLHRNGSRRAGIVCSRCRHRNPGHAKFCGHCGQPLT